MVEGTLVTDAVETRVGAGARSAAPGAQGRRHLDQLVSPPAEPRIAAADVTLRLRNLRMMGLLERIARRFNAAGIPLLALKGAALNLVLYDRAADRPMGDLDLLIRPEHTEESFTLLDELGCLRGEPLVREDFFPKFHYENEFIAGGIYPVKIDLHVRPFRPLRYSRLVPEEALWERAQAVAFGQATILVPAAEDMLIHLAAHSAIHGNSRRQWLGDIKRWAEARQSDIDWDRLLATVEAWRLALPVREAFRRTQQEFGPVCPAQVTRRLCEVQANWRDHLVLRQAPRDASHPVAHVAVNALCTPGWRFVLDYLRAVLLPDRRHMSEWYGRRHRGWLACARLLRCSLPITNRIQRFWRWFTKIELRKSSIRGLGVFATRDIKDREIIARCRGRSGTGCTS